MKRHKYPVHSRRAFLRVVLGGAVGPMLLPPTHLWASGNLGYSGKLLVTLQLDGGADVTQLCDPKTNTRGEPPINHWAETRDPVQIGNLRYAPVADNERLFSRFGADMLVVNGVDSQTNSHETGKIYNWTGSNAEGRPSLSALHAAYTAPEQPLAYSVYGGTSRTAGIIGYNRFDNLENLRSLSKPHANPWDGRPKRPKAELDGAYGIVEHEVARLLSNPSLSVRQRLNIARFSQARESRANLEVLAELIPSEDQIVRREDLFAGGQNLSSDLKQQMQGALLVFKSGLGSAADLGLGGFDSHENHDEVHEVLFGHLTDALFFFWDLAEELGIADRILMVIGSDFGRTNFYNEGNGKDHWPIGSYMIIEKGAPWGDRTVGVTDALHFAQPLDPKTLKQSSRGITLTPGHVNQALRHYLGLGEFSETLGHPLQEESLPLFDPFVG